MIYIVVEFIIEEGMEGCTLVRRAGTKREYEEIEQRPVFAQLLRDAAPKQFVVLCYVNNRWAHNPVPAYTSLSRLRQSRVW